MNSEQQRLEESRLGRAPWRKWGPYVSDRQWGTVREDYSADGNAWDYLPHDVARLRAYRWGEDGLAGFCDDNQQLCLGLALWNGRDRMLKERLFGLSNRQGNHGEDVKELYYYLDATPTHSYLKMLYKYPQAEFPYDRLIEENARRGKTDLEFELIDTGLFDADCYFDVFVEYAKATPEDVLMRITAHNRGPDAAPLHVIPQLWFRNTWSWVAGSPRPSLSPATGGALSVAHPTLGNYGCTADGRPEWMFCHNETDVRLFGLTGPDGYFKDGFHERIVQGTKGAVCPDPEGTKAGAHYVFNILPAGVQTIRLRLTSAPQPDPFQSFDEILETRRREADEFFSDLQEDLDNPDARNIHRQALAGMIWNKQFYSYDIRQWLEGDPAQPAPPPARRKGRNSDWLHLSMSTVISMPDKWEYPWFAAWDSGFHCIALSLVDAEFAKSQLIRIMRSWSMHPTGQLPAYEWDFSDVNPPVHGWAALRVFQMDRKRNKHPGDYEFLERVFHKLLLNFTWWVNRKDAHNRNLFQGGFLGLDNIGVFDRNQPLPGGGRLDQADGTSWMAMYCLNMMRIALELAIHDPAYQDIATKFFEHFMQIAEAMAGVGTIGDKGLGLWDEQDGFYYSAVDFPNDRRVSVKDHSMVGLIPLFAVETLEPELLASSPKFSAHLQYYLKHRPDMCSLVSHWTVPGEGERQLLSLLRGHRMKALLKRMLDESEFLSDYGVRAVSRYHLAHPYTFDAGGQQFTIDYEPGESTSDMFGGNSNWRGPIWFPVNYLIIESLQKFHHYYGDDFKIECPTGSGKFVTILGVAQELTRRLSRLFLRDAAGRRAVFGHYEKFQTDPNFRDYLLFHEYFHGDTGRGAGASHQTGWTGLIAKLLQPRKEVL